MTISGGCDIDPRAAIGDSRVPLEQRIALCRKYLTLEPTRQLERQLRVLLEEQQQRQQEQEPTS